MKPRNTVRRQGRKKPFNWNWLTTLFWIAAVLLLFAFILGVFYLWRSWPDLAPGMVPPITKTDPEIDAIKEALERQGLRGDSFGALNTLFSGVAIVGLLGTILLQIKSNQDDQRQRHKERFDTSFFELLNMARTLKGEVLFQHSETYRQMSTETRGRRLLVRSSWEALHLECSLILRQSRTETGVDEEAVKTAYRTMVHKRSETSLAPYFRIVYTILNRISKDRFLTESEKIDYGNLLRSQLSSRELTVIAVNGIDESLSGDLFDLIVEFRLLKYMPSSTTRSTLRQIYPAKTFQGRKLIVSSKPAKSTL